MARRHALSRLAKILLARRADMSQILADELAHLADFKATDCTGDSADRAFDADSDEMSSRLAELDARELSRIERAAARVKQRAYGVCEGGGANCQKRIPLTRLHALPHATLCINCERELEEQPDRQIRSRTFRWGRVVDPQSVTQDQRINFSEMERVLSAEG
jgi:DnaK suppressor protein